MRNASTPRQPASRFLLYTCHMSAWKVSPSVVLSGILVLFWIISYTPRVVTAAECPAGSEPLTAANLSTAQVSNPSAKIGMCWKSSDTVVGQEAGEAKLWLRQHASKGSNVSCMDPQFAQKLKTFMQAVPGGIPTIVSGYRPPEAQVALVRNGASKVGPCGSYHNYGLAADFSANAQTLQWMRINSFQYGLAPTGVNPVTGCSSSGFCDYGHIQIGGSKTGQCGACSNYRGDGSLANPPSNDPSLSNSIRQALGMPPPPPPPPPLQQPTPPSQPTTPAQLTSPGQTTVSPDMNTVQPTSSLITIKPINVSDLINANAPSTTKATSSPREISATTSPFDLILGFGEEPDPVSNSIDIGRAVMIDLNPDTRDVATLSGARPIIMVTTTGATANYQTVSVPQTFTSGDLANNSVPSTVAGQNTFVLQLLDSMKRTLLFALSYLKPFGGYTPVRYLAE